MNLEKFTRELEALGIIFKRPITPELVSEYYQMFGKESESDWSEACQKIKVGASKDFPLPKDFYSILAEIHSRKRERTTSLIVFDCDCGHSFSVRREHIENKVGIIDCPGRFYGHCNKSYEYSEIFSKMLA